MLTLPPSVSVFLCLLPVDMRKSFDGLCALAQHVLFQDPLSGHLFVFVGKTRKRVKCVFRLNRPGISVLSGQVFRKPAGFSPASEATPGRT